MLEWIYQLPVAWMALIILAITWLGTWAIHASVMALAKDQRARIQGDHPWTAAAVGHRLWAAGRVSVGPGLE